MDLRQRTLERQRGVGMYVLKGLRTIRELRECATTTFKKRGINMLEFFTKRNDEKRIVAVLDHRCCSVGVAVLFSYLPR
jgi:hypothetical protein